MRRPSDRQATLDWVWHGSLFPARLTVTVVVAWYFWFAGIAPGVLPDPLIYAVLAAYAVACLVMWIRTGAASLNVVQRRGLAVLDAAVLSVVIAHDPVPALPLMFLLAVNPLEWGVRFGASAFRVGFLSAAGGALAVFLIRGTLVDAGNSWEALGSYLVLCITVPYGLLTVFGQVQVRAQLATAKRDLEYTAKNTGVGLFVQSIVGNQRDWDEQARHLLGWSAARPMPAERTESLAHVLQEDRAGIREALAHVAESGEELVHRFRVRVPDTGAIRYLEARARPGLDAEGRVRHVAGCFIDVSEAEYAQQAMAELHERFESAVEAAGIGTWTCWPDTHEFFCDARFGELVQVDPLQVATCEQSLALLEPDSSRKMREVFEAVSTDGVSREVRVKRRVPHHPVDTERWFHVRARGTEWKGDQVCRVSGAAWDITDLVRAETAESRFRQRHDAALQSAQVGCWYWDAATRQYQTDSWVRNLMGYPSDWRVRTISEFLQTLHSDDVPRVEAFVSETFRGEKDFSIEYRVQNSHPTVRWMRSFGRVFRDDDGRVTSVSGVLMDVTTEVTLRLALERSNAELDDFTHLASHDLREPLRGIRNYANFLQEDYPDQLDEPGQRMLQSLARLADRLGQLITDLHSYARVGRTHLNVEQHAVDDIVDNMLFTMELVVEESGANILRPMRLPSVECDASRIGEVFRNLISNALKYNDKTDKIVEIGFDSTEEAFYVRDNGAGIPTHAQSRVFDMFQRMHTGAQYADGTGAGLALTKRIVERHGGRIWFDSTPDVGSTFYFTIGTIENLSSSESD